MKSGNKKMNIEGSDDFQAPEEDPKAGQRTGRTGAAWKWLFGLTLLGAVVGVYSPALNGGFVWDDDAWTTGAEALYQEASGLWRIWTEPTAMQQYYPVTATTFWMDYHLWGWWTLPYHLQNVLLHACAALLFWRLLLRLQAPAAWLAACVFALHPVMAESVAWITERKNVLSMVLFLAALLAYDRFSSFSAQEGALRPRRRGMYGLALLLFCGALLAKVTAFALPPVILLLGWWKRGSVRWRADVLPTLPFFILSIGVGYGVGWLETHHVGAKGDLFGLPWPERVLVAGRAFWFYAGKLLAPVRQCFFYPRWDLDASSPWQWLFPLSAAGFVVGIWLARHRIGRGLPTAVFYFAGTLFPVLGLLDVYGMLFAQVADHWVYLSSLGVITAAVGLLAHLADRWRKPALVPAAAALLLPVLGGLTWIQARQYKDAETLLRTTLKKNPDSWISHNNLGGLLYDRGQWDEAMVHFREALKRRPDYPEAINNLALILFKKGEADQAMAFYRRTLEGTPSDYLRLKAQEGLANALVATGRAAEAVPLYENALSADPESHESHNNLGVALLELGRVDEAIGHLRKALELRPEYADACNNLGITFFRTGKIEEALANFRQAIERYPDQAEAFGKLGETLLAKGQVSEALAVCRAALEIRPDYPSALFTYGNALLFNGQSAEAAAHFERALAMTPQDIMVLNNLAWVLATSQDDAVRDGLRALTLARQASQLSGAGHPVILKTLAAAEAECGRFSNAVDISGQALSLAQAAGDASLTESIRKALDAYLRGRTFRELRESEGR